VPGITENIISDTIILRYGADESLEYIKNYKDSIAAVLAEPVQSRNPGYQPKKFISELRNICTEKDIILVFDEIITGFRYSNSGTMGFYKVIPDLVTFGKTIGGGMPVGVVSGKSEIMDYIDGGRWKFSDDSYPKSKTTFVAGTFCHHPLTMAVSKCVLEELKNKKSIQMELNGKTDILSLTLNRFFRQNSFPILTENFGSLFYFKVKGNARFLFYGMLREGIYVWEGRTCFLSTAHSEADIGFLIDKIMKVCFELRQSKII
jgi:glutamate-1-semialdehyde aminotransferase